MQVRRASSCEAGRIVEILRGGFPADRLPLSIYGCPGLEAYVADLIRTQEHGASVWYVLAESAALCGFAEFRRDPRGLFLNHIFLEAAVRGRGWGSGLLSKGIVQSRDARQAEIQLDVFADNSRARAGYHALGFQDVSQTCWLERPLPCTTPTTDAWHVSGLGQADLVHARYGFSEFSLQTARGVYRVGRLGDQFFRVTEAAILDDGAAQQALARLDGSRRLVAIGPAEQLLAATGTVRAHSFRMAADVDTVLHALAARRLEA